MFDLSPKVIRPFLAGLIAYLSASLIAGSFDKATLVILAANLLYAVIGVASPPAAAVDQYEVNQISRRRR